MLAIAQIDRAIEVITSFSKKNWFDRFYLFLAFSPVSHFVTHILSLSLSLSYSHSHTNTHTHTHTHTMFNLVFFLSCSRPIFLPFCLSVLFCIPSLHSNSSIFLSALVPNLIYSLSFYISFRGCQIKNPGQENHLSQQKIGNWIKSWKINSLTSLESFRNWFRGKDEDKWGA